MNNDLSSSSSTSDPSLNSGTPNDESLLEEETAPIDSEDELQRRKRTQHDQRNIFLDHLIRITDIMVYCQLSILYYMDPSLPRFLLRAIPQFLFFTPKPFPLPAPHHYHIPFLLLVNLFCLLWHAFTSPPAASEATRGYLHGGLLIDFVGQASPASRIRLVAVDTVTLVLQLLALAVTVERRGPVTKRGEEEGGGGSNYEITGLRQRQTQDAEERGVRHSSELASSSSDDIEMQPLHHRGRTSADDVNSELEEQESGNAHPLDTFHSGQHIIADLHLLDTIRSQWTTRSGALSTTTNIDNGAASQGSSGTRAVVGVVEVAGRRLGFQVGLRGEREDGDEG